MVNNVRFKHYQNELVGGSMHLISSRLKRNPEALTDMAIHFEAEMHLINLKGYTPKYHHRYNIKNYRLILEKEGRFYHLIQRISDDVLLTVRLSEISTRQLWATLSLLSLEFLDSQQSAKDFIKQIQPFFPYEVEVIDEPEDKLDSILFDQVKRQYPNIYEYANDEQGHFFIYVKQKNQVIKLGPIAEFNPTPWYVIALIFLNAVLFLGLFSYWHSFHFENQIKQLERATNRLARGYLSARVVVTDSNSVSSLGLGFNKMAGYIERLIAIQREMVRAISHELRTPVARVRFGLQMIEDVAQSDEFVNKQLQGIDGDIRELDELIDEILTYARLEDGAPVVDFQLANLAQQAMQVVSDSRPPEGVVVSYSGLDENQKIKAEIEPRYIHRAIQNLVGNACRYAQSRVSVNCEIANGICRVDVEDDGAGIPEEDRERVFTPFARLDDSRTRSSGGYGLGLSIVQRIAYWHGGRVTLKQSDALGGAHFSIVWPQYQE